MRTENVKVINLSKTLPLPKYETESAAGMDVMACFDCGASIKCFDSYGNLIDLDSSISDHYYLEPGERCCIPTGLRVAIPEGYEIQVRPRSGNALKKGLTVLNTPGTIDSDYRGTIGIILINLSQYPIEIKHGDKIAQIVLKQVDKISWWEVNELDNTKRGEGGFGHTS